MSTMIEIKGAEYVAAWPSNIARSAGCPVEIVIRAVNNITGSNLVEHDGHSASPLPEIATMTPDTAKAVVAETRRIAEENAARRRGHCSGCGLPLTRGECKECV